MPNKACKFRLYPTVAQKILLAKTFGCVRLVYNHWLDRKISQYKEDQTALSYTSCAKELTVLKKTDQYDFLKEVDSISLQQSLRHLDQVFQNFFNQPKKDFHDSNPKETERTAIRPSASIRISSCPTAI
ncbi:hypothetical protein EROP_20710 [Erysipelotrichaceae bacterium OPF54]|nr:hypothetical protein EROP_20710 [Erysipelotrichaceae bacterium OPF54]